MHALWRTNKEITDIYRRNAQTVFRVCTLFFRGNVQDAEDAVQTTFLKLMQDETPFHSPAHERAWLIVTAGNVCKDMLRLGWRTKVDLDEEAIHRQSAPIAMDETLRLVMALPDKLKTAVYLHYYEGYSVREIAGHMGKSEPTVWRYLHDGRERLKAAWKEEEAL